MTLNGLSNIKNLSVPELKVRANRLLAEIKQGKGILDKDARDKYLSGKQSELNRVKIELKNRRYIYN